MAKDWDKLSYSKQQQKLREMSDALGIDRSRYGDEGETTARPGMRGSKGYTTEDYEKAVVNAMQNDYDTRRSIEAGKLSGNKRFNDIGEGISNIGEAYAANRALKKVHKKDMGNSGNFSSANDYGNVTNYLVNEDRDKQTAAYDAKYAKTSDLNAMKDKLMSQATEDAAKPIEPSDRMAQVEERLEKAAGGSTNRPPSLFDKDNVQPAKADDQADAARNFLNDYKKDVVDGANIKSDISLGISNAAKHVRDTYGR